jgi:hypothetical protein
MHANVFKRAKKFLGIRSVLPLRPASIAACLLGIHCGSMPASRAICCHLGMSALMKAAVSSLGA